MIDYIIIEVPNYDKDISCLANYEYQISNTGEIFKETAELGHLQLEKKENKLIIKRSLTKYIKGESFSHNLNRIDFIEPIRNISKELDFNINSTIINKIEFSINLFMECNPNIIIDSIISLNSLIPNKPPKNKSNTLYFNFYNGQKCFKIYNKSKERKSKGYPYRENVLRVELKLTRSQLAKMGINSLAELLLNKNWDNLSSEIYRLASKLRFQEKVFDFKSLAPNQIAKAAISQMIDDEFDGNQYLMLDKIIKSNVSDTSKRFHARKQGRKILESMINSDQNNLKNTFLKLLKSELKIAQ